MPHEIEAALAVAEQRTVDLCAGEGTSHREVFAVVFGLLPRHAEIAAIVRYQVEVLPAVLLVGTNFAPNSTLMVSIVPCYSPVLAM